MQCWLKLRKFEAKRRSYFRIWTQSQLFLDCSCSTVLATWVQTAARFFGTPGRPIYGTLSNVWQLVSCYFICWYTSGLWINSFRIVQMYAFNIDKTDKILYVGLRYDHNMTHVEIRTWDYSFSIEYILPILSACFASLVSNVQFLFSIEI